jgi:hypothetical protein
LPPPPGPAERRIDCQRQAEQHAERARRGALAERRVAETLRAWARDLDPAAGRQEPGVSPADQEREGQDQERDREPEDKFGDNWCAYRERDSGREDR